MHRERVWPHTNIRVSTEELSPHVLVGERREPPDATVFQHIQKHRGPLGVCNGFEVVNANAPVIEAPQLVYPYSHHSIERTYDFLIDLCNMSHLSGQSINSQREVQTPDVVSIARDERDL